MRSMFRLLFVVACIGIFVSMSVSVQDTYSKNKTTPRVSNALQVAAGGDHTCAIQTNGSIKCWGSNSSGQLGIGNQTTMGDQAGQMGADLPKVDLRLPAIQLSAGDNHNCAILADYSLKCWGDNTQGKLGVNDTANRGDAAGEMGSNLPTVNLGIDKTVLRVSAGVAHTCAILNDNTLKCWGQNAYGQLGTASNDALVQPATNPVDLTNGRTAVAVSAGLAHTCAILNDGSVH